MHNNHSVKPLHITLPRTSGYVKRYGRQTKWMYFLIEADDLLEKYNTIWDKVSSESVSNKNSLKTKIKSHGDEVTGFYDKEIPKVDSNYTCLSANSLNSTLKKDENCFLQVFLKECKYIKKIVVRHVSDNLSDFSYYDDPDEEEMFFDEHLR